MTRRGSVAFLYFSNHVMISVFYNTYDSTGLNIDGLVCTLLEDEYITKKARLNELDGRIKEIMEERQSILVEIEDFEKKKRLAKEIIS
ncbi:hypothetical protein RO3G_05976 [Rhizopus delemar RA 99-880]|uniref:Uncharacterized protein n=1 Tax=Rhizopus delemar (strain RA 99-880 / ATCC MYA-4621 / FGSC 9543 / NRRL 43880) TaxID=246409 RepID=I1BYJ1_RHIO9|nr:hypothetical protein RO3G_05976 [Rhizopus delemar RA 99-880]|eukprot:EIE81271.1 hypothetical protein RO3G_05976 [Rhizopus delemar RA 99-880]